jgi:hypothetical protein
MKKRNSKKYVHEIPCEIPWKFHGKINEQNFFSKKFFHEIPGGTSRDIHGTFLDLELPKLSVGTFYSGDNEFR